MTASDEAIGGGGSSSARTTAVPDHFDPEEIEDPSNPYPRPLFLVPLPPLARKKNNGNFDILAYGGDDGKVYLLDGEKKPRAIRKYDDEVKAIAVSPDGLRVSIGFDDGSTKIYAYDENEGDDEGEAAHHPFIPPKSLLANPTSEDGDDDDDEGFLSQAAGGLSQDEDGSGVVEFDGPRMDAAIRQMAFDPRCGGKGKPYHLAIVSESGNQPLAIVDAKDELSAKEVYLDEKSMEEHDMGGVRSVSYSAAGGNVLLATLGMDGKLVAWDVSSNDPLFWDTCHKDYSPVVPRADGGMAGDAGDKGCRVIWDTAAGTKDDGDSEAVLFLPGQTDVQYRLCPLSKMKGRSIEALTTEECKGHLKGPSKFVVDARGNGHNDTIVAMAVCPNHKSEDNGNRIATGGRDGKLLLWDLDLDEGTGEAREIALERRANTLGVPPVTSIVWRREEELHVAFANGTVMTLPVPEVGPKSKDSDEVMEEASEEMDDESVDGLATQPADKDAEESEKVALKKSKTAPIDEDTDYEFAAPADSTTSPRKGKSSKKNEASKFIDDEAEAGDEEDDDLQYDSPVKLATKSAASDKEDDDDGDIQYDDAIKPSDKDEVAQSKENDAQAQENDGAVEDDVEFDGHGDPIPPATLAPDYRHDLPPLQPAFAPSSTPLGEPRRILCWNHVGVVTLRSDDDEGADSNLNLVDIAFHETAGLVGGRRPVTLTDNVGYIVGTVGDEGAMFASDLLEDPADSDDEDDVDDEGGLDAVVIRAIRRDRRRRRKGTTGAGGSRVHFHRFETFGRMADKDWSAGLPDGERALGCATGSGWGAVITSRRFLRLFTISGIQGPVHWIPGEPVTVVGRDRFVAVFYHRAATPTRDGTQLMGYSIVDGITGAPVVTGEVSALSPGASLSWAGFTDKCALSVMDSDGMLSMLARYGGPAASSNTGNWMPMLDTVGLKKSVTDVFWPVEVYGGKLVCVALRGGKDHPDATRRPVTTTLNLRIPLAMSLTGKSGPLEEGSVRATFALHQEKVLDNYLVSQGEANEDEIEEEYAQKCNQVDKVTLKLFGSVVQSGKVERGYDLVQRLHSEKSYDIAIQMADRIGHRKLSDRIDELRLRKFPPIDEEEEEEAFDDDAASFDSGVRRGGRSDSFDEDEPVIATRQQRMERMARGISPERGRGVSTSRQGHVHEHDDLPEGGYSTTEEESPPRESLKRKLEEDNNLAGRSSQSSSKKRINPFAKKKMESPAKGIMKVPHGSPTKLSLSRASTFSAKSRQKQRCGKQIV
eukprot:CAMPEP_0172533418 /NCGR_PEP_ID=MMETSP1067-20121228/6134_1 /TAXON_ID=265564 ORGANISM="Thalassiosira punctigera, Strain Tpunct2005C2" /NCGR_SAMPLE_ID=MMETSP1067 /ASSEMBLY_ACC=CAM_ASM_000444 /LENGTH=1269 /DNA_ID=CAMNT_0013318063 /DNA_START=140 /DNA_END=3949 /DNA_ORIENTATION=+